MSTRPKNIRQQQYVKQNPLTTSSFVRQGDIKHPHNPLQSPVAVKRNGAPLEPKILEIDSQAEEDEEQPSESGSQSFEDDDSMIEDISEPPKRTLGDVKLELEERLSEVKDLLGPEVLDAWIKSFNKRRSSAPVLKQSEPPKKRQRTK